MTTQNISSDKSDTLANVPQFVLDSVFDSKSEDWKQHPNGGGWIYKTAFVEESVYIHPTSIVYGDARVSGDAWVFSNARVYGDARVSGNAQVYGNARVYGNAQVSGDAQVYGNAQVSGDARVSGDAQMYGDARVCGDAQMYGDARVCGDAWVFSVPYIQGTRHALTLCTRSSIAIGCRVHDFVFWKEHYKAIGKNEGYTKEQIAEYGKHIDYLIQLAESLPKETPKE